MELVTPDIGLLFWMLLSFSLVLLILKKFAWAPILTALKDREDSIESALLNAEKARKEVEDLKSRKDEILNSAKLERDEMIKIAHKDISEYKETEQAKVDEDMKQKIRAAIDEINQQKRSAVEELKESVAHLSIEIAEKILTKELENKKRHDEIIQQSVNELEVK
tara:strand:- start:2273 stop:2767 length:495 start_codon:yes stop_codon:yes gene_type:complete